MPFLRPTLSDQRQQIAADIAAGLFGTDALLRFSNLNVLGDALAALNNGLYGYLDWIAKQAVPFTAEDEFLEAWAAFKGLIRKGATPSSGEITFRGVDGTVVPKGTIATRNDGVLFATTAATAIVAGTGTAPASAALPGGNSETAPSTALTLSTPISGIGSNAVTLTGFSGGADVEDDDAFRARMLKAFAAPPQGGAATDYEDWALEVPGVTRAWAAPLGQGPGTVTVYVMLDQARAAIGGFPLGTNGVASDEGRDVAATGDQLLVADALFALRPITALVYVVAPGQNQVSFTIAGIAGASAGTKAQISAAIAGALLVGARPGGSTPLSVIEGAIAAIPAAAGFVITNIAASNGDVSPGAAGNIVSDVGYLPVFAGINFV